MDPQTLRDGLDHILDLAAFFVRMTGNAKLQAAVQFLRTLIDTPGLLEEVLALFSAKGLKP